MCEISAVLQLPLNAHEASVKFPGKLTVADGVFAGHRRPTASPKVTGGATRQAYWKWIFDQTDGTFTGFAKLTACVG
jgi:hypothetical protein